MRSMDAIATLEELGSSQWGLVTAGQAKLYDIPGVTLGRLRDNGIIHQVRRGVWALPSAEHGPLQGLRAAWLATNTGKLAEERLRGDVDVAVSHVSAASVHALGDLIPPQYEFTSEKRRQTKLPDLRFHRANLEGDVTIVDGLPVTSIPRTVEDLAGTGTDLDHLGNIIRDALASPEVRPRELAKRLDPVAKRHGYDNGSALVEDSLDRTGLPTVAANLGRSRALANLLAKQYLPTFRTELLEAFSQSVISQDMLSAFNRSIEATLSKQLTDLAKDQQSFQQNSQKAVAPFIEENAQVFQSMRESLLSQWTKQLLDPYGSDESEPNENTPMVDDAGDGITEEDGAR